MLVHRLRRRWTSIETTYSQCLKLTEIILYHYVYIGHEFHFSNVHSSETGSTCVHGEKAARPTAFWLCTGSASDYGGMLSLTTLKYFV